MSHMCARAVSHMFVRAGMRHMSPRERQTPLRPVLATRNNAMRYHLLLSIATRKNRVDTIFLRLRLLCCCGPVCVCVRARA
jgi:hypothetical protein